MEPGFPNFSPFIWWITHRWYTRQTPIPTYKESGTNEWVCDVCPNECAHAVASGLCMYRLANKYNEHVLHLRARERERCLHLFALMRFLITRVCAFSSFIASFCVVHLGNFNCISGRLTRVIYMRAAVLYGFGQCWFLLWRCAEAQQPLPDKMGNELFTRECEKCREYDGRWRLFEDAAERCA